MEIESIIFTPGGGGWLRPKRNTEFWMKCDLEMSLQIIKGLYREPYDIVRIIINKFISLILRGERLCLHRYIDKS